MNLKNRLKKVEENLAGENSVFCECFGKRMKAFADSIYDDVPYKDEDFAVSTGNYCDKCQKPVNVGLEQAFERNVEAVYGDGREWERLNAATD